MTESPTNIDKLPLRSTLQKELIFSSNQNTTKIFVKRKKC